MESDETSGTNSSSKDVKKFASDAKWLYQGQLEITIPALFLLRFKVRSVEHFSFITIFRVSFFDVQNDWWGRKARIWL